MNLDEYKKVKNMTYNEYCDYLQAKYGIGLADYMTKSFNPNPKCKRTKEGLIAHHKAEDKMIMLSEKRIAQNYPFEWQKKEEIVYCDYLEHLLLHVLICAYPSPDQIPLADVGIGGVINFIAPELNDVYSGWKTKQEWRKKCHEKIIDDKEVYFEIMKQFVEWYKANRGIEKSLLHRSFNDTYGEWNITKNKKIFKELDKLW